LRKSTLEQREAVTIAKKIGADLRKDGAHQLATLRHAGKIVLTFGIRHSKKTGQGHLVGENRDLKLNLTRAKALAACTFSKDEYFQVLKERGIIPR
jgi:hypothetical protein